VFMDCFGYDSVMKSAARRSFGGPVVLARTLAARLIVELCE
jgi:AroM protein